MHAIFLYNPDVVQFDYGRTHPFRLERLWLTEYLCRELGLFDLPGAEQRSFEPADPEALGKAHNPDYLEALRMGSEGIHSPALVHFGLIGGDNPVFPGLWEYSLYTAGGSLTGARLLAEGEAQRVFHPGGGLHHAFRSRAAGFCYVNDVVLAIHSLLERGQRVFYLDIDAHHGDGVQEAFYDEPRVLTLSIHQDGRTLFPGSGFLEETGAAGAEGCAVNVPLMPGMSDPEYEKVWQEIVLPLLDAYDHDLLITELGADALLGDPLTNLELHLRTWWALLQSLAERAGPWMAVGGGGYDLGNAMRAWTLAWGAMVGWQPTDELPPRPEDLPGVAAEIRWPPDLWRAPAPPSPWRPEQGAIDAIIAEVQRQIFPHHGL